MPFYVCKSCFPGEVCYEQSEFCWNVHLNTINSIVWCFWTHFHFERQKSTYCRCIPMASHLIDLELPEQAQSALFCLLLYASVTSTGSERETV